ncbi:lysophospholipid acyltransferase family protein [Haloplasma contractile]|uniref:1-acyl-sn-glycerol-3-phosphate acyltransferase protein n=1 Tax=Haloplasma contractile SSD-17B TaxID=1033810 RepID=U2FLJ4_9MOLU|nr:lysophospholipid acyltransferase family protein [Haloplasma contractile]ERJ13615.1 1-acyl-sn-glycerol-3-phosphate acyltransferase protein [Haloplasma contractile SSD-17B]
MFRIMWVYLNAGWYVIRHLFVIKKKINYPDDYTIDEKFEEVRELNKIIVETSGLDIMIEGKENLKNEPVLYVANHASMFDPYILGNSIDKQLGAVIAGDEWYQKIPIISNWFKLIGSVYLNRKNTREGIKAIKEAATNIKNGHSILVFPEGEITQYITNESVGVFKGGSFKIATKANVPIIPIAMIGTDEVYKSRGIFGRLYKHRVVVKILEPYTKHLNKTIKTSDIANDIRQEIMYEVEKNSAILKAENETIYTKAAN